MTQQIFEDLIGTPPASTVDVDAIVRHKSGQLRLRRRVVTGALLVVALVPFVVRGTVPSGTTGPPASSSAPAAPIDVGPSGGRVPPDFNRFIDDAMRNWLPQGAQWIGPPPHIELPADGADVTQTRAGVVHGGRKGTVVITVWPRGKDDAAGCQGLDHCTELPRSNGDDCARYEDDSLEAGCRAVSKEPMCGRVDGAVRPGLGLTRPGWELRCAEPGGRAVSILVTNQTGAPGDPLPQPELPIQPAEVIPIITVLLLQVQ